MRGKKASVELLSTVDCPAVLQLSQAHCVLPLIYTALNLKYGVKVCWLVQCCENMCLEQFIQDIIEGGVYGKTSPIHKTSSKIMSRLNPMKTTGDTGVFLKSALGALVLFGMSPEEYWPYVPARKLV